MNDRKKESMNSLYLAVGYKCNHNCRFCPCGRDGRKALTYGNEDVLSVIDSVFSQRNIDHVTLSGGEPTIQPCFYTVLKRLSETSAHIEILSNADSLADKSVIEKMVSFFPAERLSVVTAFHSHIPELHEMMNGSKGSFSRSMSGLHNLESYGISYSVKHIFNKYSYKYLPEFTKWFFDEFSRACYLIFTGMDLCGVDNEKCGEVAVSCKEITPFLESALSQPCVKDNCSSPKILITDFPLCSTDPVYWKMYRLRKGDDSGSYIGMTNDGRPCSKLDNISDCAPFFDSCKKCDMRNVCPGLWSTTCRYFGDNDVSAVKLYVGE